MTIKRMLPLWLGIATSLLVCNSFAYTMYQEDSMIYRSLIGPPTCKWQKISKQYCSSCSWYSYCGCDPSNPDHNKETSLGEGFTGPVYTEVEKSFQACGSSSTDASAKVPGDAYEIQAAVNNGYNWCISYKKKVQEATSCAQPNF